MLSVAIQVKELIASNVTSAVEAASNPVKMLMNLQREIEEAIISLQGERTRTSRHKARLEGQLSQHELRETDWGDKARTAMNHDREDLARQALLAREDCTAAIARIKDDIAIADASLDEIDRAITQLEAKREDTREQARQQKSADAANTPAGTPGAPASKADRHMGRISEMEKRTEFATEDFAEARTHASVDQEIEDMRRASKIEAELAAMKAPAKKAAARKAPAKKTPAKKA